MSNNEQHVELVKVTPDLAHEWLGWNTHNRKLRERIVTGYATDMLNGDWHWNGESIKFASDGTLLDGQHRLAAVVAADMTVSMLVVRGLPSHVQDTVDGGVRRKFNDVLQLRGEKNSVLLAAITRRVTIWEAGYRRSSGMWAPTNAQLMQTLDKYPDLREIATYAHYISNACALPGSIAGLGIWIFTRIDTDDRDQLNSDVNFFFERLRDGQNIAKGDPIYELRRTIDNSRSVRGARSDAYLTAIMVKAWNAYRAGERISVLRYRPGGSNPEQFPEPK